MKRLVRRVFSNLLGPFPEQLTSAQLDWRLAIVRFGTGRWGHPGPDFPEVRLDFTTSPQAFRDAIAGLKDSIFGVTESGTEAIDLAVSSLALRAGASRIFVLFTDENDDLPVSIERGRLREPPKRWLKSPRRGQFQARLDATAQRLIDNHVELELVVNPRWPAVRFQYGGVNRLDAGGHLDAAATYAELTALHEAESLQGQLLASGRCSSGVCTQGKEGQSCMVDFDCALLARTFNVRFAKTRDPGFLFAPLFDDILHVACKP
jgi:hypothetical protein